MRFMISALLGASLLAACGGNDTVDDAVRDVDRAAERTVDRVDAAADRAADAMRMMVGEWNQETPFEMSAAGQTFTIMNGEAEYNADGTSEIEAMLVVAGLPDGENTFEIELDGTYSLNGNTLTERFTGAEVEPVGSASSAAADAIQKALAGAGTTTSTVTSIDDGMLVRNVPGIGELRYSK